MPELVNVDNFACADSERMRVAFREDTVRDVSVDVLVGGRELHATSSPAAGALC